MQTPSRRQSESRAPHRNRGACWLLLACAALSPSASLAEAPNHFNEARAQELLLAGQAALEDGDLSLAQTNLDQAIQLFKINEGLYSTEQLAPIEQLMWAQMRAGLWPQLDTSLGYYYWLLERIESTTLDAQLAIAKNMRGLYLEAAAHPNNPMPPRHLSAAMRTNWQTLSYIEATLGAQHPALLPWLYDGLLLQFIESRLNERQGLTNYQYKTNGSEFISGWSLSRREAKAASHSIGLSLLGRIETISRASIQAERVQAGAQDTTAYEAKRLQQLNAALALYRGDWERLSDNENGAKANYAKADRLAAFHKVPRAPELLPRASFETDPKILASETKSGETSVSQHWAARFPGVTQQIINALTGH
jgi:hypothetical protein